MNEIKKVIREFFEPITFWFSKLDGDDIITFMDRYIFFVAWSTIILISIKILGLASYNWEFVLFPVLVYVLSIGFVLLVGAFVYLSIELFDFLKSILTWK